MAKHSKGKHSQPKAAVKFEKKKASKKSEKADQDFEETTVLSSDDEEEFDVPVKGAHASAVSSSDQVTGEMAPVQVPVQPQPAQSQEQVTAQPDPRIAQVNSFQSAMATFENQRKKRKRIGMAIGISFMSVVLLLAIVYLGGVYYFSNHFLPNTHIANIDISMMEPKEVQSDFDNKVKEYSFKVKGHGLNIAVTSEDAGLDIDSIAMTDAISAEQNPWRWPIDIFSSRDVTAALTNSLNATKLNAIVDEAVAEVNAKGVDPIDATSQFDVKTASFLIVPEVQGTKLSPESVLQKIVIGAMNLEPQIVITEDALIQPAVFHNDKRLMAANDAANDLIVANLQLVIGGIPALVVDADEIATWVSITPEFQAVLDEAAMNQWITELVAQFNTVGSTRTYTRADGKVVTVTGGDYGWSVDGGALASSIASAIKSGTKAQLDIPVLQAGTGYTGIGGRDWGNRYIDVDLSEQHARFYDENGAIIWESDIVSGAPGGSRETPCGVFDINSKGKNVTLTGRDSHGNITYESKVTFWMPFKANTIGLHDATWQRAFGGSRYRSGAGSHGCVNLPYGKAEQLYGMLNTGDVVVVHK